MQFLYFPKYNFHKCTEHNNFVKLFSILYIGTTHHGAAVSALRGSDGIQGLVRMVQLSPEQCVIDGSVDGLVSGPHDVKVHVYGDITKGCNR